MLHIHFICDIDLENFLSFALPAKYEHLFCRKVRLQFTIDSNRPNFHQQPIPLALPQIITTSSIKVAMTFETNCTSQYVSFIYLKIALYLDQKRRTTALTKDILFEIAAPMSFYQIPTLQKQGQPTCFLSLF